MTGRGMRGARTSRAGASGGPRGERWCDMSRLLAVLLIVAAGSAWAGRVHPDLEARLAKKTSGDLTAVIVELEEQASAQGAAASTPARDRRARGNAVVKALRET